MLIRIVKLTFLPNEVKNFVEFLKPREERIRNFPGCTHLDILQDIDTPNIFMTYSCWESKEALDQYRHSEFFKETWTFTKARFAAAPEAWSTQKLS